jgi:hypothetical protein
MTQEGTAQSTIWPYWNMMTIWANGACGYTTPIATSKSVCGSGNANLEQAAWAGNYTITIRRLIELNQHGTSATRSQASSLDATTGALQVYTTYWQGVVTAVSTSMRSSSNGYVTVVCYNPQLLQFLFLCHITDHFVHVVHTDYPKSL